MKKLFLIPLMSLLTCVMAWGATITVGTAEGADYATLKEAIEAASAGDELQLVSDISVSNVLINKALVVDLNNHQISSSGLTTLAYLVATTANVTLKNGTIKPARDYYAKNYNATDKTYTKTSNYSIWVNGGTTTLENISANAGAYGVYTNKSADLTLSGCNISGTYYGVYAAASASVTIINSTLQGGTYPGLQLADPSSAVLKSGTVSTNNSTTYPAVRVMANSSFVMEGGTLISPKYGVHVNNGATFRMEDGSIQAHSTTLNTTGIYVFAGGLVTINGGTVDAAAVTPSGTKYTIGIDNSGTVNINGGTIKGKGTNSSSYGCAIVTNYSAITTITAGTLEGNTFVLMGNGSDKTAPGTTTTISGGTLTGGAGIYHPQMGTLNISGGTLTGTTGIGIKSGTLNITGGTIHATGAEGGRTETWGNGLNESNAALQIESNAGYAGNMNITISDDATLSSDSYYAIYEYGSANTAVSSIAVTGGHFQGGILLSQSLAAKGGFVTGGKWTKDISANIKTGESLSLLNNPDGDNPPYLYLVGVPTPAQEADYAEITNLPNTSDPTQNNNAVLTNTASESAAGSHTSDNVGDDPDAIDVITTKETNPVVVSENTDVVATEAAPVVEVKKVTVDNDAQLTVTEGATLVVGAGAVTLDETSSNGLTVEAGATLVVDGLIYGSTEDNFVIESQEGKSGIVLFSPETEFIREDHPKATYRFTSKAFWSQAESKWVYQRFGVPTFDGHATLQWLNNPGGGVNSWVKKWDYENDDWTSWTAFTANQLEINDAIPFQGLMLASDNVKPDNTNPAMVYEFTGSLMGNSDANLHFYYGWNYYANSYTAPININEFIQTVKTSLGGSNDILATIYLYQDMGDDTYTWQAVNEFTAGSSTVVGFAPGVGPIYENVPSVINPMQAFLMRLNVEGEANQTIDYADNVYTPATVNTFNPAPARNRVTNNSMQISVFNANGNFDKVFFVENDNFSNDLDNGFDAYKYDGNKGVSLYAMSADKHMEILASNDVDGSFIGINAPEAGNYTLYFSGIQGMNYALIDMTNNTVVTIEEGGQFNFYAEAGQNDYRFQLVAPARVPTAVENVGAKADVKGVYTITGQYLGEDINALPKGVYIINGAKVVK